MQELNTDILKANIEQLRKATGITRTQLAKEIGMSQPNLSKALNPNTKQTFTLAQIYKLAQFFETSVDSLIGGVASTATGPRAVAAFIAKLLEQKQIEITEIVVDEIKPSESGRKLFDRNIKVSYNGFFLPNYETDEEMRQLFWEGKVSDPGFPNYQINKFLKDYIALLDMKNTGSLSESAYLTCYHELLKTVPETIGEKPKPKVIF